MTDSDTPERSPRSIVVLLLLVVAGALVVLHRQREEARNGDGVVAPARSEGEDARRLEDVQRKVRIVGDLRLLSAVCHEAAEAALARGPARFDVTSQSELRFDPATFAPSAAWWWTPPSGRPGVSLMHDTDLRRGARDAGWDAEAGLPRLGHPPRGPRTAWRSEAAFAELSLARHFPVPWSQESACDEARWRAADSGVHVLTCVPAPARRVAFYDEIALELAAAGRPCALAEWLEAVGAPPGMFQVRKLTSFPHESGALAEIEAVTFAWRIDEPMPPPRRRRP